MKPAPRSLYVLELSVQPGGSRWAELHAYAEPRHLKAWVRSFCANEDGLPAYHAIWYGATLGIWTVQRGAVTKFVDLHRHVLARVGRAEPEPLSRRGALKRLLRQAGAPDEDDDDFDLEAYARVKLSVDWDAVAARLPALREPTIAPGELATIRHGRPPRVETYLEDEVLFGSYDAEAGERLDPPFAIRGWDPQATGDD